MALVLLLRRPKPPSPPPHSRRSTTTTFLPTAAVLAMLAGELEEEKEALEGGEEWCGATKAAALGPLWCLPHRSRRRISGGGQLLMLMGRRTSTLRSMGLVIQPVAKEEEEVE